MLYEKKGRYIVQFQDIPTPRQHQIEIEVDERRGNYSEVELGFDEERALKEAKRCLSCRRCLGCALCWAECKPEAIIFEMEDEVLELEADAVVVAPGVERALDRIDRRFGKHANVITDVQLERMLSEHGPSAGLVIRPFDGEVPKSIAFVQAYASAAPGMHRAALCYGVNEAVLVRRKLPNTSIRFFAKDIGSFLSENAEVLQAIKPIVLEQAGVAAIEALEDQSLKVSFEGESAPEAAPFELVVLLTQIQISKDVKDLTKKLGLNLAYAGFLSEGGKGLITTEKDAVNLVAVA